MSDNLGHPPRRRRGRGARGTVAIAILLALVLLQVILVASVIAGARQQDASVYRVESTRALAAAESGMAMALREVMLGTDEDGDGVIGSISGDGNDANDPTISGARFHVVRTHVGTVVTLTSTGRSGSTARQLVTTLSGS